MRTACRCGINYQLDISDLNDWRVYFGFVQPARESLYSLVEHGGHVLDVGANIGEVSMRLATKVGTNGSVTSFEPDPVNFGRLSKNLSLNDFPQIKIVNVGLGSEPGKHQLVQVNEYNRGQNKIVSQQSGSLSHNENGSSEITVETIDDFLMTTPPVRLDLVKIDPVGAVVR